MQVVAYVTKDELIDTHLVLFVSLRGVSRRDRLQNIFVEAEGTLLEPKLVEESAIS
jgi:hypothetical protein